MAFSLYLDETCLSTSCTYVEYTTGELQWIDGDNHSMEVEVYRNNDSSEFTYYGPDDLYLTTTYAGGTGPGGGENPPQTQPTAWSTTIEYYINNVKTSFFDGDDAFPTSISNVEWIRVTKYNTLGVNIEYKSWKGTESHYTIKAPIGLKYSSFSGAAEGTTHYYSNKASTIKIYFTKDTSKTYTVSVTASPSGGGTVSKSPSKSTYYYSDRVTVSASPKTGYTFNKWNISNLGNGEKTTNEVIFDVINNHACTAYFTPNTYSVKFNANGGSGTMSNQSFTYDIAKNLTANAFTRTGYTFVGWATSANGNKAYNDKESVSNLSSTNGATVNLYAKWTANTYTVKFNSNGGAGTMSNQSFTYNVEENLTANAFTRTGYTFKCWNTKSDGSGTSYSNSVSVKNLTSTNNAVVNLYAQWTANTYTVKFNSNGGAGTMSNQSFTYDVAKNLTTNSFTRIDYTFKCWNTKSDGSGTSYSNSVSVKNLTSTNNAVVNLYAQWTAKKHAEIYFYINNVNTYYSHIYYGVQDDENKITFNGDSFEISTTDVTCNKNVEYEIVTNSTIHKMPKILNGKELKKICLVTENRETELKGTEEYSNNNIVFNIHYGEITYTVTLNDNGGSGGSGSVTATYGLDMPTPISKPSRTGHTFLGYFKTASGDTQYYDKDCNSAKKWDSRSNTTLYAHWSINTYNIIYKDQGNKDFSGTHNSGYPTKHTYDTATTLKSATKKGYTFGGWFANSNCSGTALNSLSATGYTSDIPLYAKWTLEEYTITYNLNGGTGTMKPTTYTVETSTFTLPKPTKSGYTFKGWYRNIQFAEGSQITQISKGSTTGDIQLWAKWEGNACTITVVGNPSDLTGRLTGGGNYKNGDSITITARPKYDVYKFENWTKNGNVISTSETYTFTANGNATYVANFIDNRESAVFRIHVLDDTYVETSLCEVEIKYGDLDNPNQNSIKRSGNTDIEIDGPNSIISVTKTHISGIDILDKSGSLTSQVFYKFPTSINNEPFINILYNGNVVESEYLYTNTSETFDVYYGNLPKTEPGGGGNTGDNTGSTGSTGGQTQTSWNLKIYVKTDDSTTENLNVTHYGSVVVSASTMKVTYYTDTSNSSQVVHDIGLPLGYKISSVTVNNNPISSEQTFSKQNVTVQYNLTKDTYKVTLDDNGGSGGSGSVTATHGLAMPPATMPKRTGYTFGGYYEGTNGSGTQYYTADCKSARTWNIRSDTTLYAKWTANTYTITLNPNGGSSSQSSVKIKYNTSSFLNSSTLASTKITTPTKTGHTFEGWYTTASGGSPVIGTDGKLKPNVKDYTNSSSQWIKASNTTVYAHWSVNSYTITVNANPEELLGKVYIKVNGENKGTTYTCKTGETITLVAENTIEYVLGSWGKSGGTTSVPGRNELTFTAPGNYLDNTKNNIFTAYYEQDPRATLKINFKVDDVIEKTAILKFDTTFHFLGESTTEGYRCEIQGSGAECVEGDISINQGYFFIPSKYNGEDICMVPHEQGSGTTELICSNKGDGIGYDGSNSQYYLDNTTKNQYCPTKDEWQAYLPKNTADETHLVFPAVEKEEYGVLYGPLVIDVYYGEIPERFLPVIPEDVKITTVSGLKLLQRIQNKIATFKWLNNLFGEPEKTTWESYDNSGLKSFLKDDSKETPSSIHCIEYGDLQIYNQGSGNGNINLDKTIKQYSLTLDNIIKPLNGQVELKVSKIEGNKIYFNISNSSVFTNTSDGIYIYFSVNNETDENNATLYKMKLPKSSSKKGLLLTIPDVSNIESLYIYRTPIMVDSTKTGIIPKIYFSSEKGDLAISVYDETTLNTVIP